MPPQISTHNRRVGASLRALRKGVGLSLDAVVERAKTSGADLSKTALSDYEKGRRRPGNGTRLAILQVIADEMFAKARPS